MPGRGPGRLPEGIQRLFNRRRDETDAQRVTLQGPYIAGGC